MYIINEMIVFVLQQDVDISLLLAMKNHQEHKP